MKMSESLFRCMLGVLLVLCALYGFINLPKWINNAEIVETIQYGVVGLLMLTCLFLWATTSAYQKEAESAGYYQNLSKNMIENSVRQSIYNVFAHHLYSQDTLEMKVDVFLPRGLINVSVLINDKQIEIEPFYYFDACWMENIESAKEEYVVQRTGEV